MAKKKAPKPSKEQEYEADRILKIWKDAAEGGLGGKRFAAAVVQRYEPRLRAKILERLVNGDVFDATAEENTKKVAEDTGIVCAIMTAGNEVKRDTFQDVFLLFKKHPRCPRGRDSRLVGRNPSRAGAGVWCDIPL
jgi:hypothetical protein